jgi:cold shock CspA family protein
MRISDAAGGAKVRERCRGAVKFYNAAERWGFLVPSSAGPDVFVHGNDCADERKLFPGVRVSFIPDTGGRGKSPVAREVKIERVAP